MVGRPSDFEYPRRIAVDDTDPRVAYDSGTWNFNASTFDNFGVYGDPYKGTMRGTNSDKAGFTFHFEGDFIQVKGAKDNHNISRPLNSTLDSIDTLPEYTCQIDNFFIEKVDYRPHINEITNNVLCEGSRLFKGPHTLIMNITLSNPSSQIFWLDSIEYAYLEGTDLSNEVVKIDGSDPVSCMYHDDTDAWREDTGDTPFINYTGQMGATMSFRFNGSSVSLYSFNEGSKRDWDGASGHYNIDNTGDMAFDIPASKRLPSNSQIQTDWWNQHLFTSNKVGGGKEHEMIITYTSVRIPAHGLDIDYFYVTGAGASGSPEGPADGPRGGNNRGSGNSSGGSKMPVGMIAGGVIGGVVALLGMVGFIWLMMRRRRQSRDGPREGLDPFMLGTPGDHMQEQYHNHPQVGSGAINIAGNGSTSQNLVQNVLNMKSSQRGAVSVQTRQHQDSGARYNQVGPSQVVDVPPSYTSN
ncbi:hypothetical protein PQX77_011182 [Marasmius sp. AFHP31]|nr:hypothetical protein PQX77_011182 [Marasmius sp. AFHP31]